MTPDGTAVDYNPFEPVAPEGAPVGTPVSFDPFERIGEFDGFDVDAPDDLMATGPDRPLPAPVPVERPPAVDWQAEIDWARRFNPVVRPDGSPFPTEEAARSAQPGLGMEDAEVLPLPEGGYQLSLAPQTEADRERLRRVNAAIARRGGPGRSTTFLGEVGEIPAGTAAGAVSTAGTALQGFSAAFAPARDDIPEDRKAALRAKSREAEEALMRGDAETYSRLTREIQKEALVPVTQRGGFQAGERIRDWGQRTFPATPGYEESFGRQVGEGLGSLATGIAASIVHPGAATVLFTTLGMGEAADRAAGTLTERHGKEAVDSGAYDEQITRAAILGVGPGMTDQVPVEVLLKRLPVPGAKAVGQAIRSFGGQRVMRALGRIGTQGAVEAVQEGGQQALQNLIARHVHTPETELGEGVVPGATVGGAVGSIAGFGREAVLNLAGRRSRSARGVRAQAAEAVPEPTPEDEASPIPTEVIVEGRKVVADAEAKQQANEILTAEGMPPIGTPVRLSVGNRSYEGVVTDAWGSGPEAGIAVTEADGTVNDSTLQELYDFGIELEVLPPEYIEQDPRLAETAARARTEADRRAQEQPGAEASGTPPEIADQDRHIAEIAAASRTADVETTAGAEADTGGWSPPAGSIPTLSPEQAAAVTTLIGRGMTPEQAVAAAQAMPAGDVETTAPVDTEIVPRPVVATKADAGTRGPPVTHPPRAAPPLSPEAMQDRTVETEAPVETGGSAMEQLALRRAQERIATMGPDEARAYRDDLALAGYDVSRLEIPTGRAAPSREATVDRTVDTTAPVETRPRIIVKLNGEPFQSPGGARLAADRREMLDPEEYRIVEIEGGYGIEHGVEVVESGAAVTASEQEDRRPSGPAGEAVGISGQETSGPARPEPSPEAMVDRTVETEASVESAEVERVAPTTVINMTADEIEAAAETERAAFVNRLRPHFGDEAESMARAFGRPDLPEWAARRWQEKDFTDAEERYLLGSAEDPGLPDGDLFRLADIVRETEQYGTAPETELFDEMADALRPTNLNRAAMQAVAEGGGTADQQGNALRANAALAELRGRDLSDADIATGTRLAYERMGHEWWDAQDFVREFMDAAPARLPGTGTSPEAARLPPPRTALPAPAADRGPRPELVFRKDGQPFKTARAAEFTARAKRKAGKIGDDYMVVDHGGGFAIEVQGTGFGPKPFEAGVPFGGRGPMGDEPAAEDRTPQPQPILRKNGEPYQNEKSAALAARSRGIQAEPVEVPGGWGLREIEAEAEAVDAPATAPSAGTAPPRRSQRPRAPMDALQYIAANGGIREVEGDLAAMGADRKFIPGRGMLTRKTGKTPDAVGEMLWEAGYFPGATERPTVADVYDMIAEGMRGNRTFRMEDRGELERRQAEQERVEEDETLAMARLDIDAIAEDWTLMLPPETREELALAVASGQNAEDVVDAYVEREALQYEPDPNDETDAGALDVPGWEGAPGGTAAGREAAPEAVRGGPGGPPGEARRAPEVEATAIGDQYVVPGAERISDRQLAERRMEGRQGSAAPQKAADEGLFDVAGRGQKELFQRATPEDFAIASESLLQRRRALRDDRTGDLFGTEIKSQRPIDEDLFAQGVPKPDFTEQDKAPPPPKPEAPAREDASGEFDLFSITPPQTEKPVEPPKAQPARTGIEDFGEKIEGARKDLAAAVRDRLNRAAEIDIAEAPLSESFPQVDYARMVEAGGDRRRLALYAVLRAHIPNKPRRSYKLRRWVNDVEVVREAARQAMDETVGFGDIESRVGDKAATTAELIADLDPALWPKAAQYRFASGDFNYVGGENFPGGRTFYYLTRKGRTYPDVMSEDRATAMERARGAIEQELGEEAARPKGRSKYTKINVYQDRQTKDIFLGFKGNRQVVRLKTGFQNASAAREYLETNRDDLQAKIDEIRKGPSMRRDANRDREGKPRREGDVTPQLFSDTFGFRGVQFGNYVEGGRRQRDLNDSFDALMDLADAVNVPPKALALDGTLGLAFGARGRGGRAAAHYEPTEVVINLTKTAGPGSLAHEWLHALDANFGTRAGGQFLTDVARPGEGMRPEVTEAWRGVTEAIGRSDFATRARGFDAARSKPYWSQPIELAARAFERYVHDRLAFAGFENDYLVNIDLVGGAYPTAEEMQSDGIAQAFDRLFDAVEHRETPRGVMLLQRGGRADGTARPEPILRRNGEPYKTRQGAVLGARSRNLDAEPVEIDGGWALQRAWHGSPHRFDRFSTEAIGTGEGQAVYGHGLYFSSKREVAEWYRDETARQHGAEKGSLYRVELAPAEDEYLLWDGLWDDQSETVVDSLYNSGVANQIMETWEIAEGNEVELTGQEIYEGLTEAVDFDQREASKRLRSAGIRGIKYHLGDVRTPQDESTYNYVIFDDSDVAIEEIQAQRSRAGAAEPEAAQPDARVRIRPTRRFDAERLAIRAEIEAIGERAFGKGFDVRLADRILTPEGDQATGAFDPAARIAYIALRDPADMTGTLHHEGLHYLRRAGAFTRQDGKPTASWKVLEAEAPRWREKYKIDERYPAGLGEDLLNEEAIAEAIDDYAKNRPDDVTGKVKLAMDRILAFWKRLGNAIRGRGFQTWTDVFEGVSAGDFVGPDGRPDAEAMDRYLQVAWHASPHRFDRFSTENIGTGEGAQAYGWGLYFAQKKGVAEWYRKHFEGRADTGRTVAFNGKKYGSVDDPVAIRTALKDIGVDDMNAWEIAKRINPKRDYWSQDIVSAAQGNRSDVKDRAAREVFGTEFDRVLSDFRALNGGQGGPVQDMNERLSEHVRLLAEERQRDETGESVAQGAEVRTVLAEELAKLPLSPEGRAAIMAMSRWDEDTLDQAARVNEVAWYNWSMQDIFHNAYHEMIGDPRVAEDPRVLAAEDAADKVVGTDRSYTESPPLYRVDLAPKENQYLQWDRPINRQSAPVKEFTRHFYADRTKKLYGLDHPRGAETLEAYQQHWLPLPEAFFIFKKVGDDSLQWTVMPHRAHRGDIDWWLANEGSEGSFRRMMGAFDAAVRETTRRRALTGEKLYEDVRQAFGSPREASLYMLRNGVRGIKYLDQSSRPMPGALGRTRIPLRETHNYVIFDDSDVAIEEVQFQTAWHGSPHRFDRFSTGAIGRGEGNQAYGWGLYFSEQEDVAKYYRDNLSGASDTFVDGEALPRQGSLEDIAKVLADRLGGASRTQSLSFLTKLAFNGGFVPDAMQSMRARAENSRDPHEKREAADFVAKAGDRIETRKSGATYRVDLAPADDEYLLWDRPFDQQSEKVQAALRSLLAPPRTVGERFRRLVDDPGQRRRLGEAIGRNERGSDIYRSFEPLSQSPTKAAKQSSMGMLAGGIRGIKYRDGMTRGRAGEGSYNYVIFDDADVTIEEAMLQRRLGEFDTEPGAEGADQAVIPGAEPASRDPNKARTERELAETGMKGKKRGRVPQDTSDFGLFGDGTEDQGELFQRVSAENREAFEEAASQQFGVDASGAAAATRASKSAWRRLAGDLADELYPERRMPKNVVAAMPEDSKDIWVTTRLLGTPSVWAKKSPWLQEVVNIAVDAERHQSELITRLNREWDEIRKPLSDEEFEQLNGLMYLGDAEARAYTAAELDDFKVSDKVKAAYPKARAFLDKLGRFAEQHERRMKLDLFRRRSSVIRQMAGLSGMSMESFRDLYKQRAKLKAAMRHGRGNPEELNRRIVEVSRRLHGEMMENPDYAALVDEADSLEARLENTTIRRRVGYVPHKFFGNWQILKANPDGAGWEHVAGEHGFFNTRLAAMQAARELAVGGEKLIVAPVEFQFPDAKATVLTQDAFNALRGKVRDLLQVDGDELDQVLAGIARTRNRRRFAGFEQFREDMPGFSKDLDRVIRAHIGEVIRYTTLDLLKYKAITAMEKEGLQRARITQERPELQKAVENFLRDVNGQKQPVEEKVDTVLNRRWATPLRVGLGSASAAFILTGGVASMTVGAPITAGLLVGSYVGWRVTRSLRRGGEFKARSVTAGALSDMAHWKLGMGINLSSAFVNLTQTALTTYPILGRRDTLAGIRRLNAAVLSHLRGAPNNDWKQLVKRDINPVFNFAEGTKNQFQKEPTLAKLSMLPFQTAEGFNRSVAFLGAVNQAERQGKSWGQAVRDGIALIERTQFNYGASGKPELLRNVFLRVPLQFKNYMVQLIKFMFGLRGAEIPRFALSMALMAGALGFPGLELWDWLLAQFFDGWSLIGEIEEQALKLAAEGELGQGIGQFIARGVPGALGVDISSRVGAGKNFTPTGWRDLMGPWFGTVATAARHAQENASVIDQIRNVTPGIGNPLKVMEAAGAGGRISNPYKRDRIDITLTPGELVTRGLGFRPIRESMEQDWRNAMRRRMERTRTYGRRYVDRAVEALQRNDRRRLMEIMREAGAAGFPITGTQIRSALRGAMTERAERTLRTLPKSLRGEARELRRGLDRAAPR